MKRVSLLVMPKSILTDAEQNECDIIRVIGKHFSVSYDSNDGEWLLLVLIEMVSALVDDGDISFAKNDYIH